MSILFIYLFFSNKMFVKVFFILSNLLYINSQDSTGSDSTLIPSTNPQDSSSNGNVPSGNSTNPSAQQTAMIMAYKDICVPTPMAIDVLSQFQDDCTKLNKYPTNESEFYCCRLEFQEKENSSAPLRKGCMAFLTNYVDNDRYEDIIDYIERGKQDQIKQYSIFLGKTASEQFDGFLKNRTKYKVNKFDCSFKYIMTKFFMMLVLIILLY